MNVLSPPKERASDVLAVAINTCQESDRQVMECLRRVHDNLPGAAVYVFVNGGRSEHNEIAKRFGFQSSLVRNYGNNRLWYLWWKRMLKWFVTTTKETLLKIDPDTMVDAPPAAIPTADYFGCIDDWFVQGGVTGLSRTLAKRLLAEKMLCRSQSLRCAITTRIFADDKYLAKTISSMGVAPNPWSEVYSRWKIPVANDPLKYCIVHPRYYREKSRTDGTMLTF